MPPAGPTAIFKQGLAPWHPAGAPFRMPLAVPGSTRASFWHHPLAPLPLLVPPDRLPQALAHPPELPDARKAPRPFTRQPRRHPYLKSGFHGADMELREASARPVRTMSDDEAHLTGREIVVATGDRELTALDSGGKIRFGGSQLIDAHFDICPNRVVELIARLIE